MPTFSKRINPIACTTIEYAWGRLAALASLHLYLYTDKYKVWKGYFSGDNVCVLRSVSAMLWAHFTYLLILTASLAGFPVLSFVFICLVIWISNSISNWHLYCHSSWSLLLTSLGQDFYFLREAFYGFSNFVSQTCWNPLSICLDVS